MSDQPDPGQTHWEGCWKEGPLHYHCAVERVRELERVANAVLLFHSGSPWDLLKSTRWFRLTGRHDATTRVLCDVVRAFVLPESADVEPEET